MFIVAAESSGDALGADLVQALRARMPDMRFAGVGGARLAAEGIASATDISALGVLGPIDGLLVYRRAVRAVTATIDAARAFDPDVAVLIDSWGFTLRVAHGFRAFLPRTRIVKYVGPQVWATRPGRAGTLAKTVDHLICIHDFEPAYYAPHGLACTVCGHPALGRYKRGDGTAFRARHGLADDEMLLLVLPGSRRAEIKRVGPILWRAAALLKHARPRVRLMMVAAGAVSGPARADAPDQTLIVDETEKEDAFAAARVAIAASGTVTTEVALQETPVVVGYKLDWLSWAIARGLLLRSRFVTLMNVAADDDVAPEFVQTTFTPERVARAAAPLLDDDGARTRQVARQSAALARMGRGARPAAEIAADAVIAEIARAPCRLAAGD